MQSNNRILIVDALRGFALLLIIMVHYIEHFELFAKTEFHWLIPESVDSIVFKIVMFIVGGKAYSIFALMFGFSFYIQLNRAEQKGIDFRGKFAWRLAILLIIGFLHSLLYKGDILHMYALMAFFLIPLYKLKIKHLLIIASFFILQIPVIIQMVLSYVNKNYTFDQTFGANFWSEVELIYTTGSFWDVIKANVWMGRTTVWGWTFYSGRYLQLFGLFIMGLVIGKTLFFERLKEHKEIIKKVLILSPLVAILLLAANKLVLASDLSNLQKHFTGSLLYMWSNVAFTLFYVSALISLQNSRLINSLAVYGKMSLSNYVVQAVCGVVFFYHFGFGLYKYLGSSWSVLMGIGFFILQVEASKYWISRYYYGPLEWFWRALTHFDFTIKLKREKKLVVSFPLFRKRDVV